jgi:hypothetical protein
MAEKGRHIALPPATWGPIFWNTMHIVALGYSMTPSEEEKMAAKHFYESLVYLIPCPICRVHYKEHLASMSVTEALDNRSALLEWTWKIHNEVNKELGKPTVTMDQFLDHISSLKPPAEQCCHTAWHKLSWVSVVGALAIGGIAGYSIYAFSRKSK